MPTSTHSPLGTVQAIQYDGTNVAEIQAALGARWNVYTSLTSSLVAFCQTGQEMLQLNAFLLRPTDWMVSQTAYSNTTPALSGGFSIMSNSQFTQWYSA